MCVYVYECIMYVCIIMHALLMRFFLGGSLVTTSEESQRHVGCIP